MTENTRRNVHKRRPRRSADRFLHHIPPRSLPTARFFANPAYSPCSDAAFARRIRFGPNHLVADAGRHRERRSARFAAFEDFEVGRVHGVHRSQIAGDFTKESITPSHGARRKLSSQHFDTVAGPNANFALRIQRVELDRGTYAFLECRNAARIAFQFLAPGHEQTADLSSVTFPPVVIGAGRGKTEKRIEGCFFRIVGDEQSVRKRKVRNPSGRRAQSRSENSALERSGHEQQWRPRQLFHKRTARPAVLSRFCSHPHNQNLTPHASTSPISIIAEKVRRTVR